MALGPNETFRKGEVRDPDDRLIVVGPDGVPIGGGGGGSGTEYTEGTDSDATPTGTAIMWKAAGNAMVAVSAANPLPVTIPTPVPVTDNGGSLTVDGTVSVTEPVSVDDNGGTLSVDDGGGALTVDANNLDVRDLAAATDSVRIHGTAALTSTTVGSDEALDVNVVQSVGGGGGGGTQYTENDAIPADAGVGTLAVARRDDALSTLTPVEGDAVGLRVDSSGALWVRGSAATAVQPVSDNGGSLTVDGTVTADTELPAAVALANNIANPTTPMVGAAAMLWNGSTWERAAGNGDLRQQIVGGYPHGNTASMSSNHPLMIGGYAEVTADVAPGNRTGSTEDGVTRVALDRDGAIFTHPHGAQIWQSSAEYTTQQTNTSIHAAPGAGLSLYITDIYLACNAAVTVTLETPAPANIWKYYAASQGQGVSLNLTTPIKVAANTAIQLDTSAGVTIFLTVTGYVAPG